MKIITIMTSSKVIWSIAELLFVCIRQMAAAAICSCMFWPGVGPPIVPSSGGQGPHLTRCLIEPLKCTCQMASKSVERFKHEHECDRRQTDRQTDRQRYEETCIYKRNCLIIVNCTVPYGRDYIDYITDSQTQC